MARRLLFGAALTLAVWVALWGLLVPAQIERAIPWALPPLHARFVGALYLSGAVCMLGMLVTDRWSRQAVISPMIAIWTGALFLVLLLRLDEVGPTIDTLVVWFLAYTVLPVTEVLRSWRHRGDRTSSATRPPLGSAEVPLPPRIRALLLGQGITVTLVAAAMLLLPATVAAGWPWSAPDLAIQIYGGPLLAYGVGSVLASRRPSLDDLTIVLPAFAVFAAAVLVVSALNARTFQPGVATWIWFATFGSVTVLYGWLTVTLFARKRVAA